MVLSMHDDAVKDIERIYLLNRKLLKVIGKIGIDIVNFSKEYNYPLPVNLKDSLDEADKLIIELNHPTVIDKRCSICRKLNQEDAEFCCYCGSSLIITRVRQGDKSPFNATEPETVTFI